MGWKITPNTGVTIDENSGIAKFSPNTTETPNIYEISYESEEGCGECKKTVIVEPKTCNCSNASFSITLDKNALEVSNEGGTIDVPYSVECGEVTASCSNATVVVSDGKVTFTIPSNDTYGDKVFNCKIGINGDSTCSESFNIRQKGTERELESCSCKDLRIGGANIVPYTGGTVRISYTIDCEGEIDLAIDDNLEDSTTLPTNAVIKDEDGYIELKFGENDSEEKKVYSGIITLNGSDCRAFSVTQNAKVEEEEEECTCIGAKLTVSADKSKVSSTGDTVTVSCSVTCGGDMKYKFEDESEQTVQDGKITLTIPSNDTDEPKRYKCYVWVIDENCGRTIYIDQDAKGEEEEKECDESEFSIDKEVDESNVAKVTVTGDCEFDWKEVCKVTHCCNGKVDQQVSPTSLFEVSSTTVTQGDKCVTTIYAKTLTRNESNIEKNGIVDIHISADVGGSWTLDKWRVPISSKNCPPTQDPCDYLTCGDIIINAPNSIYGFNKQDGVQIATYTLGEDCVDDNTKVTNVTASGGLTIASFDNGKILANFPDLSDCEKEPLTVEYTVTVSYQIDGNQCPDETFDVKQYQNSAPCDGCTCEEAVTFYYQYDLVHSQDFEKDVELIRYSADCGDITKVTATVNGVGTCNCSIDGPDELEYNVGTAKYSAATNYSTVDGSITITSWNNGKIIGDFPDLSECGLWSTSPITHKVIVEYGDGCSKTFEFEQEANTDECCLCETLIFTPSDSSTYDVTYAEQNVFTITTDQKCPLTFSMPSWIRAVEMSEGVYDIYVDNNASTSDRSGNIEVKSNESTCITHTINQAGTPPPPPTGEGDTVLSDFDYMTFIYRWSSEAGTDLDTATVVLNSGISGLDGYPIGFSCSVSSNDYLRWGGDNTGTGTESACINLSKILSDMAEGTTTITIEFYGNWYSSMGTGEISMEYYTYKGGTMTDPSSSGDLYINNGGELIDSETRNVTVTVEEHSSCVTSNMFKIGQIVYDVASKTAVFSTY